MINLQKNRIDQAIFESEQEIANGAEAVDAEIVFAELERDIEYEQRTYNRDRQADFTSTHA